MKAKYIFFTLLLLAGLTSCELWESLDKMQPEHKMTDENILSDAKSAEALLNGVYESLRTNEIGIMRHYLDVLTGTESVLDQLEETADFKENAIKTDNSMVANNYSSLYNVVNTATSFLKNLGEKPVLKGLTPERRVEMKGEARFLRAQAYLILLRQYGEFAKGTSEYGIVLYGDEPIRENMSIARSTVADSYKAILVDLDSAILQAPKQQEKHYRVGTLVAKALKTRVMLYMKEFGKAAELAKEVIAQAPAAGYALEKNFKKMFENSFESSEMLFAIYSMGKDDETYTGGLWWASEKGATIFRIAGSQIKGEEGEGEVGDGDVGEGEDEGDAGEGEEGEEGEEGDEGDEGDEGGGGGKKDLRFVQTWLDLDPENPSIKNSKYPTLMESLDKQDSHYYIRLAEIYYILAEAEARLGNTGAAKDALKKIICLPRAGYTADYVDTIPDGELMKTILEQKWLELNSENNEEWFDLVRYRVWDNFPIMIEREKLPDGKQGKIIKGYIQSDTRLLLPIPRRAFVVNKALKTNNPGYQNDF